jgi:hypothetical protein
MDAGDANSQSFVWIPAALAQNARIVYAPAIEFRQNDLARRAQCVGSDDLPPNLEHNRAVKSIGPTKHV